MLQFFPHLQYIISSAVTTGNEIHVIVNRLLTTSLTAWY